MNDENPKPTRPYTDYNIFFQLEREYILQVLLQVPAPYEPSNVFNPENDADYRGPPLPSRYTNLILPSDWYVPGKEKRRKRRHRKSHGKIGFHELSLKIADAWKVVDEETRSFCSNLSDIGMLEYKKQMRRYKLAESRSFETSLMNSMTNASVGGNTSMSPHANFNSSPRQESQEFNNSMATNSQSHDQTLHQTLQNLLMGGSRNEIMQNQVLNHALQHANSLSSIFQQRAQNHQQQQQQQQNQESRRQKLLEAQLLLNSGNTNQNSNNQIQQNFASMHIENSNLQYGREMMPSQILSTQVAQGGINHANSERSVFQRLDNMRASVPDTELAFFNHAARSAQVVPNEVSSNHEVSLHGSNATSSFNEQDNMNSNNLRASYSSTNHEPYQSRRRSTDTMVDLKDQDIIGIWTSQDNPQVHAMARSMGSIDNTTNSATNSSSATTSSSFNNSNSSMAAMASTAMAMSSTNSNQYDGSEKPDSKADIEFQEMERLRYLLAQKAKQNNFTARSA